MLLRDRLPSTLLKITSYRCLIVHRSELAYIASMFIQTLKMSLQPMALPGITSSLFCEHLEISKFSLYLFCGFQGSSTEPGSLLIGLFGLVVAGITAL